MLATHVANVSGPCEVCYAFLNEFFKGIFGMKASIWHVVAMQLEVKGKIGREKTSVPRVEKKGGLGSRRKDFVENESDT